MPILSELTLYPIKSCAGIALREATLTPAGLMHAQISDREWMVVDAHGQFLSQREHPTMARITPRLKSDTLELRAPGMLRLEIALDLPDPQTAKSIPVRVWDDELLAYDCDEVTATWFSQAIGTPCRLVRFHPAVLRTTSGKWTDGERFPTLFADAYPFLLIGEASLEDLNLKLAAQGRPALPMNRFRPNLVLAGLAPFEEDLAQTVQIGPAVLQPVKPCARCPIPSVDQASGAVGADPLDILMHYRSNPKLDGGISFGMNAILREGPGTTVRVGETVGIRLAF